MLQIYSVASLDTNVCAYLRFITLHYKLSHVSIVFLAQLLLAIGFLLSEVLLQTSFLVIPYKFVLQRALPEIYTDDSKVELHPYFASGLLFVSVTTLALFFASGMYSEKIAYANQFVFSSTNWYDL